jgi:hypothetical protein
LEGGVRRYFVSLEQIGETVYEKQNVWGNLNAISTLMT